MAVRWSKGGLALVATAAVVLVGGGIYFYRSSDRPADGSGGLVDAGDLDLVALGARTYDSACATCHGVNLQGQPNWRQRKPDGRLPAPPHDDGGHTWHHDDQTLFLLTKYGAAKLIGSPVPTDMPTFEGVLSDEEIRAVLAFIKSRWSETVRGQQAEINKRAGIGGG